MKKKSLFLLFAIAFLLVFGTMTNFVSASSFEKQRNFYQFKLGSIEMIVITDGHVVQSPVQPNFAPDAPVTEVLKLLQENFMPTSEIDMALNILLLKYNDKIILVDAGCGNNFGGNSGWLKESLKQIKISPSEITDIVITHAHPDHVGGMTDENRNVIFSNANIYLSSIDYNFWTSPNPDFSTSKLTNLSHKKMLIEVARKNISAYKERLHLFDDGEKILECMEIVLAPGHTPGHSMIKIFSEEETMYHIADLVHSPLLPFTQPEWGVESETDYNLATKTRKHMLDRFATEKVLIFAYHLPYPGLGHIKKNKNEFIWIPQLFVTPF